MKKKIATLMLWTLILGLTLSSCSLLGGLDPTATTPPEEPKIEEPVSEPAEVPAEDLTEPEESGGIPKIDNLTYPVVDTGQAYCYGNTESISCPGLEDELFGQDAQYPGFQPNYADNGDGTITDLNTGLMWPHNPGEKMTYSQAVSGVSSFALGEFTDWRLPTIKELYSLMLFSGYDPSGCETQDACPDLTPFIDTRFFDFKYGQTEAGERLIDAQYISSTPYIGPSMGGDMVFGVNFADGRIKGYGTGPMPGSSTEKTFYVLYVRGDAGYGINDFLDNADGTITDQATGLTWMQTDSQQGYIWEDALAYCENLAWAGFDDWRLPNAKELQSILDYSRSPDTSKTAAIASIFHSTPMVNEAGEPDYGFYWTSTTHVNRQIGGKSAAYLAYGRALGHMEGSWVDVHGAGAQRSDPKMGDPGVFPTGLGPQGDAVRIINYARCLRDGLTGDIFTGGEPDPVSPTDPAAAPGEQIPDQGEILGTPMPDEPPEEAFVACEGKTTNTACVYDMGFGPTDGVCNDLFGQLVCMPGVVLPTLPSP